LIPEEIEGLYRKGEQLFQEGRFDGALALFDEIERRTPDVPRVMVARARCMHALGRNYEANLLCNRLTRQHRDPRGQQLRARWKAQARGQKPVRPPSQPRMSAEDAAPMVAPSADLLVTPPPGAKRAQAVAPPQRPRPLLPATNAADAKQIRAWIEDLDNPSSAEALYHLCQSIRERDRALLEKTARGHPSDLVRDGGVRLIDFLGAARSEDVLIEALRNDGFPFVRMRAAKALSVCISGEAQAALEQAAQFDDSSRVRIEALATLQRIVGQQAFASRAGLLMAGQSATIQQAIDWLASPDSTRDTEPAVPRAGEIVYGFESGTYYGVCLPRRIPKSGAYHLLIAVHDSRVRQSAIAELVNRMRSDAEAHGLVVVAPLFDYPTFPSYGTLNIGLGRTRADIRLLEIVHRISQRVPLHDSRLLMFENGPARGFVPWFAWARPEAVRAAVVARPLRLPALDSNGAFPYGPNANPFANDLQACSPHDFARAPLLALVDRRATGPTASPTQQFEAELASLAERGDTPIRIELEDLAPEPTDSPDYYVRARSFLLTELERDVADFSTTGRD